jgi:uroporphyrinogen-III synthase
VRALVTRPREDAERFAAALAERGIEAMIEPLLEIRAVAAPLDLEGVQAVLFTSANGVRAFAAASPLRDLPALAVGDASAEAARRLGFARVESAGGDVADLAALAARTLSPAGGDLLHPAGSTVAGDLGVMLAAAGFAVRRVVLYEAVPARALTPPTAQALREGALAMAFFFSPRTARSFVSLAAAAAPGATAAMEAYCLSAAVAREAEALAWRAVRVAAAPTQPALLSVLDVFIAGRGIGRPTPDA